MHTIRNQHKSKVVYHVEGQKITLLAGALHQISAKEFSSEKITELIKNGDLAEILSSSKPETKSPEPEKAEPTNAGQSSNKNTNTHKKK